MVDHRRLSLQLVSTPRAHRTLVATICALLIGAALFLAFVPWVQTVHGSGKVTSFVPNARPQTLESSISGRIVQWFVHEGQHVRRGDTIVVLSDINVNFFDTSLLDKLQTLRDRTFSAQEQSIEVSIQRRKQSEQRLAQTRARLDNVIVELSTARTRYARADTLFQQDLVSRRDVETATLNLQRALADSVSMAAGINAAMQDVNAFRAEEERVINQAFVTMQEAEVRLANAQGRVGASIITAPLDGIIVRIAKAGAGQTVKEGEQLAVVVPSTDDQAVEVYVTGMDAALVDPGRRVSLQFAGFPAFQVSGWRDVNVGIFHGIVRVVDAVDDGAGGFRLLIIPDSTSRPWPSSKYLRQGTEASGWIMLNEVSVGYELWRQLMGFPPQFPVPPSLKSKADKGGKEEKK